MPSRRPVDDDDDTDDYDDRPRRGGRRPAKKARSGAFLPVLLIVGGAATLMAVAGVVLYFVLTGSDPKPLPSDPPPTTAGGGTGGSRAVELAVNGGFEDGPEPDPFGPGFTNLPTGSTDIRGWTVTRGSVDYIGPYWQPAEGRRSVDLNGNEPGAIAQTLRTKPGQKYRVSFRLAANCFVGAGPMFRIEVSAAGARTEFTFDATGRTYEDMGWITRSWEFTAIGAETTLEFASASDATPTCGPALDRVSVVEAGN